ncbi:MAG TPA: hypothetical protein VHT21_15280 [Stellaceae bacterium]|nr:hypothetical protein [Stellaceae bacterium]
MASWSPALTGFRTYTVGDYDRNDGVRTMDANELRALQAPLKKQYREQPETGRVRARAEATLDLDRVACRGVPGAARPMPVYIRPPAGTESGLAPRTCFWKRWSPVPA